jgi:hypothetical protein
MHADTSQKWALDAAVMHLEPTSGTSRLPTMETNEQNSDLLLFKLRHPAKLKKGAKDENCTVM